MIVKNIQIYENVPFDEYLKVPGFSFSWLKAGGTFFQPTAKMNLGSEVDNYLNDPGKCKADLRLVRPIANALISRVGLDLYRLFKKQVSILADFEYKGMRMKYKGRTDWCLLGKIVIDTKVSEDIYKTIQFFAYPDQISGYCLGTLSNIGLILAANPKKIDPVTKMNKTDLINIDIQTKWWEKQILKYGDPIPGYIEEAERFLNDKSPLY